MFCFSGEAAGRNCLGLNAQKALKLNLPGSSQFPLKCITVCTAVRQLFQQWWESVKQGPSEYSAELPGPKGRASSTYSHQQDAVGMTGLMEDQLTQDVGRFRGAEGRLGLRGLRQQGDAACYLRNATAVRL